MEGFWTVQFQGIQGWGAGVVLLINGKVYGGDNGYTYEGTYTQKGDALTAHVHVKQFVAGTPSVMGRTEFDLTLAGTLNGNTITLTGTAAGFPARLTGIMTRQSTL